MNRLRQENGFTVPELLITMVIGLTVTIATLTLVDVTMSRSGEVAARIEAVQTGRTTMDIMTRQLRSTVCIARTQGTGALPAAIEAAGPDAVKVYTELRDTSVKGAAPTPTPTAWGPDMRELSYVPDPAPATTGKIVEKVWKTSGLVSGMYQYGGDPSRTRVLLTNVERAIGPDGTAIPVFQFYKFDFVAAAQAGEISEPKYVVGTGDLTKDQIKTISKIRITYKANPAIKRKNGSATTVFTNDVFTRNVDANADTDELSEPCK